MNVYKAIAGYMNDYKSAAAYDNKTVAWILLWMGSQADGLDMGVKLIAAVSCLATIMQSGDQPMAKSLLPNKQTGNSRLSSCSPTINSCFLGRPFLNSRCRATVSFFSSLFSPIRTLNL